MKQPSLILGLSRTFLSFSLQYSVAGSTSADIHSGIDTVADTDFGGNIVIRAGPSPDCIYGVNDYACWSSLNLSSWLRQWYGDLKYCPQDNFVDTRHCRVAGEPWTSTFLRMAQSNTGGSGCTELNACLDDPPTSNDIVASDPEEAARYRYVCFNIYAINFFFSTWYQGMYNAAIEAGDIVDAIIQTVDPPTQDSKVALMDVLSALSAGLVFLSIPEAAAISGAAATIAPIFLTAIQQAPGIAKLIWPAGSPQRESIEIADLYQSLGTVVQGLGPRIGSALAAVQGKDQSDVESFLAFAQQGNFSQPRDQWVNIANDTKGLLLGFTTFLVSEALVLDGWHVEVALGVDPLAMSESNASCPYWECDCGTFLNLGCSQYDNNSQCEDNPWWYGTISNSAYTLSKDPYYGYFRSASHDEKDPTKLMQTIFNNGWSTGLLLLENARNCVFLYSVPASFNTTELQAQYNATFTILNEVNVEPDPCQEGFSDKGFYIEEIQNGTLKLNHPNDTLYDANLSTSSTEYSGTGDWSCTSQLNLTVLEDWASVWYKHRHLT